MLAALTIWMYVIGGVITPVIIDGVTPRRVPRRIVLLFTLTWFISLPLCLVATAIDVVVRWLR